MRLDLPRWLAVILPVAMLLLAACNGFGVGQATRPGSTPNIAQQTSYRVVGNVGTPFRALVSDSRSTWRVSGTVPTSIVIVNDHPPDRIVVTKTTNDARLLSLETIVGFGVVNLDSTVSNFGTAIGAIGGKLTGVPPTASPDVEFFIKGPQVGLFTALIEDETTGFALMSRIPAVLLFDSPNHGSIGRVDGIFHQVGFAGAFNIDLTIDGVLVNRVTAGGLSVTLKGG